MSHTPPGPVDPASLTPMPADEFERIIELADYGLDYAELQRELGGLARLAADIAGVKISMINLIDHYTQWTVARSGVEITQMPREDSVCQHTIMGERALEVRDLKADERFAGKFYTQGDDGLRYYFGIPLRNEQGRNMGALCVLDTEVHKLGEREQGQLRMVAGEVMERLGRLREIHQLQAQLQAIHDRQRKVSHDIRGPLSGIIGLADIATGQLEEEGKGDLAAMLRMISESGQSVIDLADGILRGADQDPLKPLGEARCTLRDLERSLRDLFVPQARSKGVEFKVLLEDGDSSLALSKNQVLQVCGNLVSNAIKYTPAGGTVTASLGLLADAKARRLRIQVKDNGIGISEEVLAELRRSGVPSRQGTAGEQGYGLGIPLVKRLVGQMRGELRIDSSPGEGCIADVDLPA